MRESLGENWLMARLHFGYTVEARRPTGARHASLHYSSVGVWVGAWRVPLPAALLPTHAWVEHPSVDGWSMTGEFRAPLLGRLMKYTGTFEVAQSGQPGGQNKRKAGVNIG